MALSRMALCAALFLSTPAAAANDEDAARFGAREAVQQMSMSPDGNHVAIVAATAGQGSALLVADLVAGGPPKSILRSSGKPDRLRYCRWASDSRIICKVWLVDEGPDHLTFDRMVSLNSDGSDLKVLTVRESSSALGIMQSGGDLIDWGPDGASGSVLMTRQFVPERTIGTHVAEQRQGLGVELVNATTLKRSLVEQPNMDAQEYISDGHGNVRVRGIRPKVGEGYDSKRMSYFYRKADGKAWLPLSQTTFDGVGESGFDPYAIDPKLDVVYGFESENGRTSLYSMALDGSLKRTLVLSNPDVDVDSLIRIGRQQRVVGASFVTDRRTQQFFDPELQKLRAALGRAIPGKPLISFIDSSADEKRLLLFAGADNDAGTYYVFDKGTRHLEELLSARPELASVALATVKPVAFPAADGTVIPAYLTLPPGSTGKGIPAIVMPHGGPGARDEWGFDWLAQYFAHRGFAVLQPNFRGSTGYGEAWFQKNGFQSWRTAIGDVNDGGRWLLSQGIAAPGKIAIVGWSYGGYAALQSAVLDPDLFKAIVAIAPVTDLERLRTEAAAFTSYLFVDAQIGHGPHVREGSPARNADRIKAPVLLFHGTVDQNVGVGESRLMEDALKGAGKKVEYVEFKGLDHQLDDSDARTQMLSKADAFLRTSLALPAQ